MELQVEPIQGSEQTWELICFSDNDFVGDPDSRRSDSGFVLYVPVVPIWWTSNSQCSVAFSRSEAEWVSVSESVKEVMFVLQLIIVTKGHTTNCLYDLMTKNISNTGCSKHVDIHYKLMTVTS